MVSEPISPHPLPVKLSPFHYGWVIATAGVLVLFCCIGLARFSYTVLIPGMHAGLHFSYERLGFIGTSNFSGYLFAVFLAPFLIKRFRSRTTIVCGLLLICISMMAISRCSSYPAILILYTLAGLGTGFANIPMMTLTTSWFCKEQRGRAAGLVICGNGLGIIFVGWLIPIFSNIFGAEGWRMSWLALGLISFLIAVTAGLVLRNDPAEMGLQPVGYGRQTEPKLSKLGSPEKGFGFLLRIGIPYLIFGTTFMIYGTFIVTTMINEYSLSEKTAGMYWSWVGFFSFFSGIAFGTLSDKIGRRYGLMMVFVVQTGAYLLAGLKLGHSGLVASIVLYGISVFAPPAIVTAAIGDHFSPSRVARAFSNATFFFAFGQTIGPACAGIIGGDKGHFSTAYLIAALLTALAGLLALRLPGPEKIR